MFSIQQNIEELRKTIDGNIKIIAVSKTKSEQEIMELYNCGQRIFGENKVQELLSKYKNLPKDIEWHLIGHLQTNKVKDVVSFVSLIHSVDSPKLLGEIDKEAKKQNKIVNCLLQIYISDDETKYGFEKIFLEELLKSEMLEELKNVKILGLMGIATNTDDEQQIKKEFKQLKLLFEQTKNNYFAHSEEFKELSIGMSGDYKIAIKQGSTMIRIGSLIFGERNYF